MLLNADSTKPKVMKSLGIPRALKTLVQSCGKAESLDNYIALNLPFVPKTVTNSMKICTVEFAGMKFKMGSARSGKDYLECVEKMLNGLIGKSNKISKIVICEEKYGYTPDEFKAGTREQRKRKKETDVSHLVAHERIISKDILNKDSITRALTRILKTGVQDSHLAKSRSPTGKSGSPTPKKLESHHFVHTVYLFHFSRK